MAGVADPKALTDDQRLALRKEMLRGHELRMANRPKVTLGKAPSPDAADSQHRTPRRKASAKMPEPRLLKLREIDVSDVEMNARLAEKAKNPVQQCTDMIADLKAIRSLLDAPVAPHDVEHAARRDRWLKVVDRMWRAYVNRHPGEWGRVMAVNEALDVAYATWGGKHMNEARTSFAMTLELREPTLISKVNPTTMALAEKAIRRWGARSGRPRAGEQDGRKWTLFTQLVKGLGLGHVDPQDAKREVSRQKSVVVERSRKLV